MSLVLSYDGQLALLDVKRSYLDTLTLRLFKNDFIPQLISATDAFVESDFAGYAPIVGPFFFAVPFTNADDKAETDSDVQTFTAGAVVAPQSIFGYYLTDPEKNWIFAERRAAGGLLVTPLLQYLVQLRVTDRADPG